ncbi:hypothetical protein [Methylobacillus sp.]|uniref:hypothetical protein n=1 Tax=Methylobacillus sp. TaxID=56818 RepID=UPI0012CE0A0C|nr:hypothetical protein [Methylobacillus sp.]MPS48529.1 hypothetical protein [Methylobacillus sp.]
MSLPAHIMLALSGAFSPLNAIENTAPIAKPTTQASASDSVTIELKSSIAKIIEESEELESHDLTGDLTLDYSEF